MEKIIKFLIFILMFLQAPIQAFGKFNYIDRKFPKKTRCKFLKELAATRDVERWHASCKIFPKPLSSHLLETSWFVYFLVSIHNEKTNDNIDPYKSALIASFHDYLEVYTGDILSTFKNSNPDAKRICLEEENKAFSDLKDSLPTEIHKPLDDIFNLLLKDKDNLSEEEKKILKFIKFADLMSAYMECVEELDVGSDEFSEPAKYLKDKMCELRHESPAFEFFCSKFLDLGENT